MDRKEKNVGREDFIDKNKMKGFLLAEKMWIKIERREFL